MPCPGPARPAAVGPGACAERVEEAVGEGDGGRRARLALALAEQRGATGRQCARFTGTIPVFDLFLIVFGRYWYWYLKVVLLELDCFRTIVFDCLCEKRRY